MTLHYPISSLRHLSICVLVLSGLIMNPAIGHAQETVFTLFKPTAKQADEYYRAKDFRQALELYLQLAKGSKPDDYYLGVARSYYYLNEPSNSASWYQRFISNRKALPSRDAYLYAETLTTLGQYETAIEWYDHYLQQHGDDPIVEKKIWQLKNKESLYEDSIHFVVDRLALNSTAGDFCPAIHPNGIVFLSDRSNNSRTSPGDPSQPSLYKLYFTKVAHDTTARQLDTVLYEKPTSFAKEFKTRFNQGPVVFYDDGKRMVYTSSGEPSEKDKNARTLQLSFAELRDGHWIITAPFPYNSTAYSITDPAIRTDGQILYFSSNMDGGFGGKDLYQSTFTNGKWSKPVNLGDQINTPGDESFPFITGNILYFTSNGHPGLGGLDIFYVALSDKAVVEVVNMGYPINTHGDDFAITLNAERNEGYFSSNRQNNNDDIYSVSIKLQTYPMTINALLQYKEESWNDSTDLKVLPNAQLFLIDNNKNVTVQTSTTDGEGKFSLTIPYFSQYKLRVIENNNGAEAFVSFDLSKQRSSDNVYKIVVVKKSF